MCPCRSQWRDVEVVFGWDVLLLTPCLLLRQTDIVSWGTWSASDRASLSPGSVFLVPAA